MKRPCLKLLILLLICFFSISFLLSSCQSQNQLLILNWGEYINDDLVTKFEKEYHCSVKISIAESNELFYSKIKSGTTVYDIVVPSDYMVEKMYDKGLLQAINYDLLPNYNENRLLPGALGIREKMGENLKKYAVPYLWGTFGLMYNKKVKGLKEALEENDGWPIYFNKANFDNDLRVAMYNVPRYAYATAMFYLDKNPNEVTKETLDAAYELIKEADFNEWGTDQLKKQIASNNLDLAFVYTGDFLDQLYIELQNGTLLEDIKFDIYIPEKTIAFMDNLVIPRRARHVKLAHQFINFMIEEGNAYLNSSVVGYCTPYQDAYKMIVDYQQIDKSWWEAFDNDETWLRSWSYAIQTYYPVLNNTDNNNVNFKGTVLSNKKLTNDDLTAITNMVNNAKAN